VHSRLLELILGCSKAAISPLGKAAYLSGDFPSRFRRSNMLNA
jgi:hypothetical protein